ncbi:tripartite tricarboxylate transporter TctB family protein, partial [Delftia tsuruhatensis]|uniref:tripartite tricarboxylate transporter TctB family protein n=2 Tax=Comamonadaceae TaxID=80864 RepID=UPI0039EEBEF2
APAQPSSAATESIPATEAQAPGLARRHVEYGVAAVLLALAVLVVWDNQRIGAGWSDTGPQAGYFPLRVGAVLGICAIAVFVQALRSRSQEQFASWLQLRRVAQVLLPLTAYIAVIAPLGIYAASVLFITGFMVFAGRYPWWKAVALSGFTSVLLFYVFEIQFKVPLPKGPLEAWLGY